MLSVIYNGRCDAQPSGVAETGGYCWRTSQHCPEPLIYRGCPRRKNAGFVNSPTVSGRFCKTDNRPGTRQRTAEPSPAHYRVSPPGNSQNRATGRAACGVFWHAGPSRVV